MTIGEAIYKNKVRIGSVIEHPRSRKLLKVKNIIPNDTTNSGVLCNYLNNYDQEDLIKRGFTCVKLMCYDDFIPYRSKALVKG